MSIAWWHRFPAPTGAMLHSSIGLLKPFGRVVVYGAASGDFANIPVRSLFGLKTVTAFALLLWRATAAEGPGQHR